MNPARRRVLAGLGLMVPAVALIFVSLFVLLGGAGAQQCTNVQGSVSRSSCAGDPAAAVLATFPAGILCLVLAAAVFRGSRWARWPAAVVGALLGTITAAGSVAVLVALAGDGNVAGAIVFALGGIVLSLACALPALLLSGGEGARAMPGRPPQAGRA